MDRIKEFLLIVENTEIKQLEFKKPDFYSDIKTLESNINNSIDQLEKITPYEAFKAQALLTSCSENINRYKNFHINDNVSRDALEVTNNLKSIIKTKYLKYTLRINELTRKFTKKQIVENTEPEIVRQTNRNLKQELFFQQPMIEEEKNEYIQERKRIVTSITEIGQMVEDISLHVNLQEESLKRIDDVIIESDKWTKKTLYELDEVWDYFRSNRSFMIKFFIFWIVVILIFWGIKKSG